MIARVSCAIIVMMLLHALVSAQPQINYVSDLISIHADPAIVPADGVSSSKITITVYWPKELDLLGGQPAADTRVDVSTTLGTLIDAKNETNRGSDITVYTDNKGSAIVLICSEEEGIANITAEAPDIEDILNILKNVSNETFYIVRNSTEVTFTPANVTASPTATPNATASPTASPTATPNATASPTASPTATPNATASPTASPTATPNATASPTASPTATPNATASPTASPTATPNATAYPMATPSASAMPTAPPPTASSPAHSPSSPAPSTSLPQTPSPPTSSPPGIAGFLAIFAVVCILAIAFLLRARRWR